MFPPPLQLRPESLAEYFAAGSVRRSEPGPETAGQLSFSWMQHSDGGIGRRGRKWGLVWPTQSMQLRDA